MYQKNQHSEINLQDWSESCLKYFSIIHYKKKDVQISRDTYKQLGCINSCDINTFTFFVKKKNKQHQNVLKK